MITLIYPPDIDARCVNDGNDVSIGLQNDEQAIAQIVFLDMQEESLGFGWFVTIEEMGGDGEWPIDGPRYFQTVKECVDNAIAEFRKVGWWLNAIPVLEKFAVINSGAPA